MFDGQISVENSGLYKTDFFPAGLLRAFTMLCALCLLERVVRVYTVPPEHLTREGALLPRQIYHEMVFASRGTGLYTVIILFLI